MKKHELIGMIIAEKVEKIKWMLGCGAGGGVLSGDSFVVTGILAPDGKSNDRYAIYLVEVIFYNKLELRHSSTI